MYSNAVESKAHFVYGLGKGWDVGANLVGKGFYFSPTWRTKYNDNPTKGSLYPILMVTAQKQWQLASNFDINVGTQLGYNLSKRIANKEMNFFNYGLGTYKFMKGKSRIVSGFYQTNQMYVGQGNTIGALLGYEIKISKRWYAMGDWVSGRNDAAVAVIGGMYNLTKRVQLCAGWQIPNPNTLKRAGVVLELNVLGWNAF